jgi:HlyD family secretion protein
LVDGKAEMMEVATGIADDTHLEVMSGLSLGDEVITGPYSAISRVLEPGMAVRNKESENE